MAVEQNINELIENVAEKYATAFFTKAQKHTTQLLKSVNKQKSNENSEIGNIFKQAKLTNTKLGKIEKLVEKISKSLNEQGQHISDKTLQFPTVINESLKHIKKLEVSSKAEKNENTSSSVPKKRETLLDERAAAALPVSLEFFSDKSLDQLGKKLNNILPKAIQKGMKQAIESMQEVFQGLADVVEDSAYRPGILDYLRGGPAGMPGGARGRPRSARARAKNIAKIRKARLAKTSLPKSTGGFLKGARGLGAVGLLATPVLAAMDYKERREEGQTAGQSIAGASGSAIGGLGGALAGAKAGAFLGALGGPLGIAVGGTLGAIGGGLLGSWGGATLADKMTGVGAKNKPTPQLTPDEKKQHDKLVKYVTSLGKYSNVDEFLNAVDQGKEGRIHWNNTKKQWEPRIEPPKNKTTALPPTTSNSFKEAVKKVEEQKGKPDVQDWNSKEFEEWLTKKDSEVSKKLEQAEKNLKKQEEFYKNYESGDYDKLPKELKELKERFDKQRKEREQEGKEISPNDTFASFMIDALEDAQKERSKVFDDKLAKYKQYLSELQKKQEAKKVQAAENEANKMLEEMEQTNREISQKMQELTKMSSGASVDVKDAIIDKKGLRIATPEGQLFKTSPNDVAVVAPEDVFDKLGKMAGGQNIDNKALQTTANETKITNTKLDGLAQTMLAMANALSKFGENLPQGTTIVNAADGSQTTGQQPNIAQYLSDMKSAARIYSASVQEPYAT